MSSVLAEVVVQLKSAIDQLDGLAVRANRAAEDMAQAHSRYANVGRGSDHPKLRAAVTQSRTGVDKAHRLARLCSDAARQVSAYLNVIAPGSVPQPATAASGPPSGEDLMADSDRRDLARERTRGLLNRAVRKADELQDQATNAVDATQQLIKVFRDPKGPAGTHSTGTGTPVASSPAPRPKIDGAEAAGNLVVVGLLAGMGARWFAMAATRMIARLKR